MKHSQEGHFIQSILMPIRSKEGTSDTRGIRLTKPTAEKIYYTVLRQNTLSTSNDHHFDAAIFPPSPFNINHRKRGKWSLKFS